MGSLSWPFDIIWSRYINNTKQKKLVITKNEVVRICRLHSPPPNCKCRFHANAIWLRHTSQKQHWKQSFFSVIVALPRSNFWRTQPIRMLVLLRTRPRNGPRPNSWRLWQFMQSARQRLRLHQTRCRRFMHPMGGQLQLWPIWRNW